MTTDTYSIDDTIVSNYTGWPLTCWNCESEQVIYSDHAKNSRCLCCNEWQLDEEEE